MSIHSQLDSSLMETSEDEEAKRKEAEKAAKKAKKGLTAAELDANVDIELAETDTLTLLYIPSTISNHDTEEQQAQSAASKAYEQLKQNKIGSDSYTIRGTQTLNLAQKTKQENFQGFTQESKEVTASNWDIDDASKQEKITEQKKQEINYYKSIETFMTEKLKQPNSLFDAEALASHISIVTSKSNDIKAGKSGSNSTKSGQKSKMKSSAKMGESRNESEEPSSSISGSVSKTQTNQFSTETGQVGDFANVKAKDIKYVEEELPDSMMRAIRIIERLLTQSKYHEQHILYKNYPPVDIAKQTDEDEDQNNDPNANRMMPFGGGKKKEEEKKEEENEANKEDPDEVSITHLFKFRCDITDGR